MTGGWVEAETGLWVNLQNFDTVRRVGDGSQEDIGLGLHWIAERYKRWPLGGESATEAEVVILLGDDDWAKRHGFLT